MRWRRCLLLILVLLTYWVVPSFKLFAQSNDYTVVARTLNSRVWQRVGFVTNKFDGQVRVVTNSFTELRTGICYETNGEMVDSVEQIDLAPDGAQATRGVHKVQWAANANAAGGAVKVTSRSGDVFLSHVYGIGYWDTSTGSNVLFGELTNSIGEVVGNNQVVYTNAFSGIDADIQYTYRLEGLEQNIILREQPPDPSSFGLDAEATRLEVITEFFGPADPAKSTVTVNGIADDQALRFKDMFIGQGTAFLGGQDTHGRSRHVTKHWINQDNGTAILVEEVPYMSLSNQMSALPLHSSNRQPSKQVKRTASLKSLLRQPRPASKSGGGMKMAQASARYGQRPGLVIDYTLSGDYGTSNFVFQGDTTYMVSGGFFYGKPPGTMIFEGGTVIKFTNSSNIANEGGSVGVFEGTTYRPTVFTSWEDNSVGTVMPGSSGVPTVLPLTTFYNEESHVNSTPNVHNVRFSYADYAYTDYYDPGFSFEDCQFVNCDTVTFTPAATNVTFLNALCSGCYDIFSGYDSPENIDAENLTADSCTYFALADSWWGPCTYKGGITNSIVTACDDSVSNLTIDHTLIASSGSGIYQTVGAGGYYLANGSPYHNAGTANINPGLLQDIQAKTTYPPVVVEPVVFSNDYTFFPQAQRDTVNPPDMGYNYDPIDFATALCLSNATVTVLPGTVLAAISQYAIWLSANATVNCQGTATAPNAVVAYNTVQEQSNTNWESPGVSYLLLAAPESGSGVGAFRFTDFSILADSAYSFCVQNFGVYPSVQARDCQFYDSLILSLEATLAFTNCLFQRPSITLERTSANSFDNNSFLQGEMTLRATAGTASTFQNNLFVGTSNVLGVGAAAIGSCSNNAYVTTNYGVLPPENNDVILTNTPTFESGALGDYYYPTNLTNLIFRGSELASAAGLYHYTVTTNNVIEGTNIVSIGFHFVAVGTNGLPLDSNGDGIPDYLEDANGNGLVDSGEIGWNVTNDLGLTVIITQPANNSTIP